MSTESKMKALFVMAANFGKEMPESLLELWLSLLAPYSAEQVQAGVRQVIADYEFRAIPPFAVLRKAIDKACGLVPSEQVQNIQALAEWGKVLSAIRQYGRYRDPEFCTTTSYVVGLMGGWQVVCSWTEEELHWRSREFQNHWKMAHGREEAMLHGANAISAIAAAESQGPVAIGNLVTHALPQTIGGQQ